MLPILQLGWATCRLQGPASNNGIILCDGCDRGFHQNCLNPHLLTEDSNIYFPNSFLYARFCFLWCKLIHVIIPFVVPDEGLLISAFDCKIYFIELINEFHVTVLFINDSWEVIVSLFQGQWIWTIFHPDTTLFLQKVFPEAAVVGSEPMQKENKLLD